MDSSLFPSPCLNYYTFWHLQALGCAILVQKSWGLCSRFQIIFSLCKIIEWNSQTWSFSCHHRQKSSWFPSNQARLHQLRSYPRLLHHNLTQSPNKGEVIAWHKNYKQISVWKKRDWNLGVCCRVLQVSHSTTSNNFPLTSRYCNNTPWVGKLVACDWSHKRKNMLQIQRQTWTSTQLLHWASQRTASAHSYCFKGWIEISFRLTSNNRCCLNCLAECCIWTLTTTCSQCPEPH